MKNKKIIFAAIFISVVVFFASYNFSLAAGCCVKDKNKNNDPSNCTKNAQTTQCVGLNQVFLDNDASCLGAIAVSYCGTSSSTNEIGCCILNTSDSSKYGTSNCLSGKKRSECSGVMFEVTSPDCGKLNSTFCKVFSGNTATTSGDGIEFPNPVGAKDLLSLVGNIMNGLRSVIVVVAIVFIVIGGIMYMSSAGSEKMIDRAKAIIGGALIGLAITLAAPTFLKEIIKILGNASGGDPNAVVSNALTIYEIAVRVLNFLLSVAGVLAIIGLVVGGVFYFTSYGDEERIEKGKRIISASLIGIAITLAAVLIVKQIMNLLGMA